MMLRTALLSLAVSCAFLVGCAAGTETKTEIKPEETTMPTATATVAVATDGVVRDAKGDAYCVVMKDSIPKASEAEYPKTTVDGVTYIFCCQSCPGMFAKEPAKYAVKK